MDKFREEFEKIEWVKERLKHVWWSQNNEYCDTGKHPRANASFLNGALHLFREQQAKVEELQKRIDNSIFILSTIDSPDEAYKAIDLLLRSLRGEQALKGEG